MRQLQERYVKKKKLFFQVNTLSVKNILNTLNKHKKSNLKYFLFISTSHVYGFSIKKLKKIKEEIQLSDYGRSKKKIEDFVFKKNRQRIFFLKSV